MKTNDLYYAIKFLNKQRNFNLNEHNKDTTFVFEYNKSKKLWEYYFRDERGGKGDIKTFATEEEACKYIINDVIGFFITMLEADIDAVRRKYDAI